MTLSMTKLIPMIIAIVLALIGLFTANMIEGKNYKMGISELVVNETFVYL